MKIAIVGTGYLGLSNGVLLVQHKEYMVMPLDDLMGKLKNGGVFVDVKSAYRSQAITDQGYRLGML